MTTALLLLNFDVDPVSQIFLRNITFVQSGSFSTALYFVLFPQRKYQDWDTTWRLSSVTSLTGQFHGQLL